MLCVFKYMMISLLSLTYCYRLVCFLLLTFYSPGSLNFEPYLTVHSFVHLSLLLFVTKKLFLQSSSLTVFDNIIFQWWRCNLTPIHRLILNNLSLNVPAHIKAYLSSNRVTTSLSLLNTQYRFVLFHVCLKLYIFYIRRLKLIMTKQNNLKVLTTKVLVSLI